MTLTTANASTLPNDLHQQSLTLSDALRLIEIVRAVRRDDRPRKTLNQEALQHACERLYQPILGIADWVITVQVVPAGEIDGYYGQSIPGKHSRTATIKISHPDGLGTSLTRSIDMEETLVHELLHVVMHRLPDDVPTIDLEQIIESISPCIVGLVRAGIQPTERST